MTTFGRGVGLEGPGPKTHNMGVNGWKRRLVTVILCIIAAILLTWAIWIGPAPRHADLRPRPTIDQILDALHLSGLLPPPLD